MACGRPVRCSLVDARALNRMVSLQEIRNSRARLKDDASKKILDICDKMVISIIKVML
jgi:hypothetical protein